MQRILGKGAGSRTSPVSPAPCDRSWQLLRYCLARSSWRPRPSLAQARWALALISPLKQCHSPSQGQQEVGQGTDSAEEISCFSFGLPSLPCLGISLGLASNGFAVCKARIELYISPLPCPLAGQTLRRGAQKLRWLCTLSFQLRDPEGGRIESPSFFSGKA